MSFNNTNGICRICLCGDSHNLKSIFYLEDFSGKLHGINEVITTCAAIQINIYDGYPQQICPECLNDLHQAFAFKRRCENSDFKLRNNFIEDEVSDSIPGEANFINYDENIKTEVKKEDPTYLKIEVECEKITNIFQDVNIKKECDDCDDTAIVEPKKYVDINSIISDVITNMVTAPKSIEKNANINEESTNVLPEKKYKCNICNAVFESNRYLLRHMKRRAHAGATAYKCDVCGTGFKRKQSLPKHMKMHCGKKYSCEICSKQFAHASTLHTHRSMHMCL